MTGTVYLIDKDLHEHAPWQWEAAAPPRVIERLRPRLPTVEAPTDPTGIVPLDRVEFRLVSGFMDKHTGKWAAIYREHTE